MLALRRLLVRPQMMGTARWASSSSSLAPLTPASLTGLDGRWVRLPECEKGAIADYIAQLEKGDWKKLSLDQKRAGN